MANEWLMCGFCVANDRVADFYTDSTKSIERKHATVGWQNLAPVFRNALQPHLLMLRRVCIMTAALLIFWLGPPHPILRARVKGNSVMLALQVVQDFANPLSADLWGHITKTEHSAP